MKTKRILALLAVMLLATSIVNVRAATEGTSSGTANVGNSAPDITAVTFAQDNTAIDVDATYTITATVEDQNYLTDLDNITYILWDSVTTTEAGADTEEDHYTYEYDEDGDTWNEIGPDPTGDSHLVLGSCSDPADHNVVSGDFTLGFKLHKTANKEAVTTSWKIKVIAYDSQEASDSDQTKTFGVNFYLEITVDDGTHSWDGLSPGTNDNVINGGGGSDGDIDVTVTANANFDLQAKGDDDLTDASKTIGLGNITIHKDTLGSSIPLTTTYADIGGLTNQAAGESQAHAFILWLDVPAGQESGSYTYTLSCQGVET